jgi:hypothetical protein
MIHEAFALPPISTWAARPSEADYEAIREAFMETARGRWFLGEYAKRNRQADTRMVLDAVARMERTLEAMQPPADTRLPAIIWNIVDQAEEAVTSAVDGLAIEERLAPIRKGARILKEISWRWREIGTDSRVCDSIDSQVNAIEESCSQLAGADIRAALTGEFELIRTRIEALAEDAGRSVLATGDVAALVAEQVELAPTEVRGYVLSPWMQPEAAAASLLQSYSPLGSMPPTEEFQGQRRASDTDPFLVIRRMSLVEKIEFFS